MGWIPWGLISSSNTSRGVRTVGAGISAAAGAYYLGKKIYGDYRKRGYRSRHYPKGDPRQYRQYNRQLSGRRRFSVGQRKYYRKRRRFRGAPYRLARRGPGYFRLKGYRGYSYTRPYHIIPKQSYAPGGGWQTNYFKVRHRKQSRQPDTYRHGRHY